MTTRRRFLASLTALAASAGLARFAGGAAKGAEVAPVKPSPAESRLAFAISWANVSELHRGKWLRPYRVVTFDERGRCVAASSKRYVDSRGQPVEVSPAEAR
jgi:hypothetical protein